MANVNLVTGAKEIIDNLKKKSDQIGKNIEKALKLAGLKLQRESQMLVPVNYGILKASAFTRAEGSDYSTTVWVGYTAAYALYVHEAVEMKLQGQPRPHGRGFYWDPQGRGQAKFLEEPMRRLMPELKEDIRKAAKL